MEALVSQSRLEFIANFSWDLHCFAFKDCMVLNVVEESVERRYSNPQLNRKLTVLVCGIDRSYRVQRNTSLCRSFPKDERSKRLFFLHCFHFSQIPQSLNEVFRWSPFCLNCLKFNNVFVNSVSFGYTKRFCQLYQSVLVYFRSGQGKRSECSCLSRQIVYESWTNKPR